VSAPSQLVFTDEQLTLLELLAGEPGFSATPAPGERLTFVESADHGLLLLAEAADGSAVLEPIAPDAARGLVAAIADTIA
jgi:hypothetical protein